MEHTPYKQTMNRVPDFIVEYEWCPDEVVKDIKRFQGMRSDFLYDGDNPKTDGIHMIWPEFLDREGHVILSQESEFNAKGYANMWVMLEERREYHRNRIKEGVTGYMVAGSAKIAKVKVMQVCGLYDETKS